MMRPSPNSTTLSIITLSIAGLLGLGGCDKESSAATPSKSAQASAPSEPATKASATDKPTTTAPAMTPLRVEDEAALLLTATVVQKHGKPTLHLRHGDDDLAAHGEIIENQLRKNPQFNVNIPDFDHEGQHYRVHVMTVQVGGTLDLWSRSDDGCQSPAFAAPPAAPDAQSKDVAFVVLAVREDGQQVLGDHYPIVRIPPMKTDGSGGGNGDSKSSG